MTRCRAKSRRRDPFVTYYRKLNAADLRMKIGLATVSVQKRRRLMRKIRRRNRPILDLARKLYPSLRAVVLNGGPGNCILGTSERITRDVWHVCVQWVRENK